MKEWQDKMAKQVESYEKILSEQEQHYQNKIKDLTLVQKTMSETIDNLTRQNTSLANRQQPEELTQVKKNNEKLIEQNKQQLEKLFQALSQAAQLKQEL